MPIQIDSKPHNQLTQRKPRNTNNNIQPLLISPGILKRPHAIPLDIPKRGRSRMHPALPGIAHLAVGGGRLVDQTLLHDGAVDGESERRRGRGGGGGGSGDEGFEDGVLVLL